MYIDLGKYVITADSMNIILNVKGVHEKGKKAGQEYLKQIGYYGTWQAFASSVLNTDLLANAEDIKSFADVNNTIDKFMTTLMSKLEEIQPNPLGK